MTLAESAKTSVRRCFTFSGRAGRHEFVTGFLLAIGLGTAMALLVAVGLGWIPNLGHCALAFYSGSVLAALVASPFVAALYIRRLHDRGFRSWWVLLFLGIPVLLPLAPLLLPPSWIVAMGTTAGYEWAGYLFLSFLLWCLAYPVVAISVLIFALLPSQPGPNTYGPNPHEVTP
ncbi:DUF805 domain-containing protein [Roseobacter sp. A03A-229]